MNTDDFFVKISESYFTDEQNESSNYHTYDVEIEVQGEKVSFGTEDLSHLIKMRDVLDEFITTRNAPRSYSFPPEDEAPGSYIAAEP